MLYNSVRPLELYKPPEQIEIWWWMRLREINSSHHNYTDAEKSVVVPYGTEKELLPVTR